MSKSTFTLTPEARKAAFEKVFMSAPQRNPANSGKDYKRPYSKTAKARKTQEHSLKQGA